MKTDAIIVAAGKGKRMGAKPKAFLALGSKPILFYSLKTFQKHPKISEIILVVRKNQIKKAEDLVRRYGFNKTGKVIAGGRQRKDSVVNGLESISPKAKYVLIHDAARPFVKKELITRIISALEKYEAAVPGIPAKDTLKSVNSQKIVKSTLDRRNIYQIQTPQGLRVKLIKNLLAKSKKAKNVYDDVILIEKHKEVKIIPSSPSNFKITTPHDLSLARFYLSKLRDSQ
ncbi:MAG: 2-C-methyl-D-erythritol 4-phosphate cytidylyltransferase [Candidatus Omnitrophica bacterium]|nr:2-C-methyl-D-erythritol 4-phosphate cytidylyltransferase [Candidatus Omnitrophota bacterium]